MTGLAEAPSERTPPQRSGSGRRAQTDPVVALVALFAVVVGVGVYAGALATVPGPSRDAASPALERATDRLDAGSVLLPSRVESATAVGPSGWSTNVSLVAAEDTWTAGPPTPESPGDDGPAVTGVRVDTAARRVPVRVAPGRVRAGTLRVVVWQ